MKRVEVVANSVPSYLVRYLVRWYDRGMTTVGMHEAKTQFSRLVDQALAGEEVVVTRRGEPVVRLAPVRPAARSFAALRGSVPELRIADDFDEPPSALVERIRSGRFVHHDRIADVAASGSTLHRLASIVRPARSDDQSIA